MSPHVIGMDFGTASARLILVDAATGDVVASAAHPYADGVIDERLPGTNIGLGYDWALQNPADYLHAVRQAMPALLTSSGVAPRDVVALGMAFTSCTVVPATHDGAPLCSLPRWRHRPHAWVKLWKHHAAQRQADRVNDVARARNEPWLARYGGALSPECLLPKVLQVLDEAPDVYGAAGKFIEGGDWMTWQLTGQECRNAVAAGYRGLWDPRAGYPGPEFFHALDPRLATYVAGNLAVPVTPSGMSAGRLTPHAAQWTGLPAGTLVAAATVDAHASLHGAGVTEPGRMVLVLGTSACHLVLSRESHPVPGICAVVEDGMLPGFFGYEAGQSAVGDHLEWLVRHVVPPEYHERARAQNTTVYALLEAQAMQSNPGATGLLALDWWNGNRSILADGHLSGVLIGATLRTRPPDIYRALIEATAFGTRIIIEALESNGVAVGDLVATGGLAERSPLLLQIYADVTGRTIRHAASHHATALGAAVVAATAAGRALGGYASLAEATTRLTTPARHVYRPAPARHAVYHKLFAEYRRLHDYFGRGENNVLKTLRHIQASA